MMLSVGQTYLEAEFGDVATISNDAIFGNLKNGCRFTMIDIVGTVGRASYVNKSKGLYRSVAKKIVSHGEEGFEGLFLKVELPKTFDCKLYLRKDTDKNILINNSLLKSIAFDSFRVELDSSEFEKIFDVYADNPMNAMQILTPEVLCELVGFYNKLKIEYELTIKENCIYLRFWTDDMFEPPKLNKFSLDRNVLYKYYQILSFIFEVVDKLVELL